MLTTLPSVHDTLWLLNFNSLRWTHELHLPNVFRSGITTKFILLVIRNDFLFSVLLIAKDRGENFLLWLSHSNTTLHSSLENLRTNLLIDSNWYLYTPSFQWQSNWFSPSSCFYYQTQDNFYSRYKALDNHFLFQKFTEIAQNTRVIFYGSFGMQSPCLRGRRNLLDKKNRWLQPRFNETLGMHMDEEGHTSFLMS